MFICSTWDVTLLKVSHSYIYIIRNVLIELIFEQKPTPSRLLSSKPHHWGHAIIGVPILISGLCVLKLPETFNQELPQTLRAARKISTIAVPQTAQEMKDVEN